MNIRQKLAILITLALFTCIQTGVATAQLTLSAGVKLTQNASYDTDPDWSPDGREIVFVSSRDSFYVNHEIYVMDANGSDTIRLTDNSVYDGDPDWSPDGTKIVFTSDRGDSDHEIYVLDVNDDSDPIRLTHTIQSYDPAWSPDGSEIAFASNTRHGGGGEIYVMNADGSNPRNLTQNGDDYFDARPAWSPDGTKIAFYSTGRPEGFYGIYVMNADGSNPTRLTDTGQVFDLTYSPDGAQIAYVTNSNIYVINAEGSNLVRLTESGDIDITGGIDWLPDGGKLVFVSARDGDKDIYVSNVEIFFEIGIVDTSLTDPPIDIDVDIRDLTLGVNIPDRNLRAAVEAALGKAAGATITIADMATLTQLDAPNANISDLTGLESATNLTRLDLGPEYVEAEGLNINSNSVSDLSSLVSLINLTSLDLRHNSISDLSALSGLTNLRWLLLSVNSISDLSALSGLTNLTMLWLTDNNISDLSALSDLTNLTMLLLSSNNASDISALSGLTNLTTLQLHSNSISDISALSSLTKLTDLGLGGNSVSDISSLSGLTNLITLYLGINSISDISALSGLTNLTTLFLSNNNISNISVLSDLTNLEMLTLRNNSISDLSPLVSNVGLGNGDTVDVSANPLSDASVNTHIPALQRRGVEVGFDNLKPVVNVVSVNIPDANLRAAIEQALDKASGTTITTADMATLTELDTSDAKISDLTGLEHATNLISLSLGFNHISDISVLSGLTNLTGLYLSRNAISDISALSGLTNLTYLYLDQNNISDISAVSGLTNLLYLLLFGNSISDLSALVSNTGLGSGDTVDVGGNPLSAASINTHIPALQRRGVEVSFDNLKPVVNVVSVNIPDANLRAKIEAALGKASGATITTADMATLTRLDAPNANISDLTGLEHATNLTELDLGTEWVEGQGHINSNSVSDLSPLAGLTDLRWLRLRHNSISDISALADLINLTWLNLGDNLMIADLSFLSGLTNLTILWLYDTNISDISALSDLANLTELYLWGNSISDISALSGLTNLTTLSLGNNALSDLSSLSDLTNLTELYLYGNALSDLSSLLGLTNLTTLSLHGNSISDISAVSGLTSLTWLELSRNTISNIAAVSGLTNLTWLRLDGNTISNIAAVSGLTNLTYLSLHSNSISNISAVSGLTNLRYLWLNDNSISDLSPLSGLINLTWLYLDNNSISDLSPLVSNAGLGSGDEVDVGGNPLNAASINTHIPTLQGRGVEVQFDNISTTVLSYTSMIPAGISLFHVPLDVEGLDTVSDLKAMLGDSVSVASVYDTAAGSWNSRSDDVAITADLGIYLVMIAAKEIAFEGQPWGNGTSMINLSAGTNLIGLPVNDPTVTNVSDIIGLFAPDVVASVIFSTAGEFVSVAVAGDPADGPVAGDAAYIVMASAAGSATLSGDGWSNDATGAAPTALAGYPVDSQTPILNVHGVVVDEITGLAREVFRVKVKNLSTKAALSGVTSVETAAGYNMTFVNLEAGHAARVGDVLEISADSPSPLIGVNPVRHIVTVDDVKASRIQLEPLIAYEIPTETQLLANYPNPFNPETWIPYRLAEDAFVTLTIYDLTGQVVRTLDVGHRVAAVYEDRSKAVYWDGRNEWGETVASGVYFYHLSAGDYSATRRMVILK